jgi:hypothetical protein
MRAVRVMVAALVTAGSWGCASGGGSTNVGEAVVAGGSGASRTTRRNPELIEESEITSRASDAANALQVIQKLRPQMLTGRGLGSPTDVTGETSRPKVYVDNISYGDLSTLSNLIASQIKEIRFLNSRDATTVWGTGHMGGVILVTTKR